MRSVPEKPVGGAKSDWDPATAPDISMVLVARFWAMGMSPAHQETFLSTLCMDTHSLGAYIS